MERYSMEGKNAADTYPALLAVVYGRTPTPPVSNEGDGTVYYQHHKKIMKMLLQQSQINILTRKVPSHLHPFFSIR
jgi:hypothetical protein